MQVGRLDIQNLRSFAATSIAPGPGLNVLTGDNGAGKTSVLEALHLMAYGRSFRGRVSDGLVRSGTAALEVFVEWQQANPTRIRRAGLRHTGTAWEGRLDGTTASQLGELCAAFAMVTFEPGSHALVSGGGEPRRRFMDWGLFHVEQAFLPQWRRYARALRQRNALLKLRGSATQLDAWDAELADSGEAITHARHAYIATLEPAVQTMAATFAPALGEPTITLAPGWRSDDLSLADALLIARDRDLSLGFTSVGPHRGDWRLRYPTMPDGAVLSRGQAKISALSCLLAQARCHATDRGEWPVIALDDLASELDRSHQARVLDFLAQTDAQIFLTGTELPASLLRATSSAALFHVEQGIVQRLP